MASTAGSLILSQFAHVQSLQEVDAEQRETFDDEDGGQSSVRDLLSEISNNAENLDAAAGGRARAGPPSPGKKAGSTLTEPFYERTDDPVEQLNRALDEEVDASQQILPRQSLQRSLHQAMPLGFQKGGHVSHFHTISRSFTRVHLLCMTSRSGTGEMWQNLFRFSVFLRAGRFGMDCSVLKNSDQCRKRTQKLNWHQSLGCGLRHDCLSLHIFSHLFCSLLHFPPSRVILSVTSAQGDGTRSEDPSPTRSQSRGRSARLPSRKVDQVIARGPCCGRGELPKGIAATSPI